jgi:hypothetical protein
MGEGGPGTLRHLEDREKREEEAEWEQPMRQMRNREKE